MSAETVLYATLAADTYVNGVANLKIYPDVIPQQISLPAIAFARIGTPSISTIHSNVPVASLPQFEVGCLSFSREEADSLADLVVASLGGANFRILERRADLDNEKSIWATVLTVDYSQQP